MVSYSTAARPPSLRLVAVTLRLADLARGIAFYADQLGFAVNARDPARAELAVAPGSPTLLTLLTLVADAAAPPAPPDAAGLFHAALLLPSRAALGAWLRGAADRGTAFDGFSDHGVSEAIYLSDPEGNGLEFYADRPPAAWPRAPDGGLAMTTGALDIPALLAAAASASDNAAPLAGAHWGHLHLRVTDLARSEKFYADTLGVALTQGSYPGARFLAADGYHHHVAVNTWGRPRRPQPPGARGLAEATFAVAGHAAEKSLRDPDGLALRLAPGA
ncbi:MAG: hypothetical protein RLZZ15_3367 [Verrucomicrobiota bacterium]|jgi:catechol 2,3-dioxygenase